MASDDTPRPIDVLHLGRDRVICAWLVGEVIVDPGPTSSLAGLLDGLGGVRPRALALTHIHLDHAGAAGSLVRRWPELEVWVHERGARHLVDPGRLLASARLLYGGEMDRLWGEVAPVPRENLRVLAGGETVGEFTVAYTPGHASHHVSYLHEPSRQAFIGDVGGVRIPPSDFTLAPTPPPDVDLEAWAASLDAIEAWRPRSLGLTHFGRVADPPAQLEAMRRRLRITGERARLLGEEEFVEAVRRDVAHEADPATASRYERALPPGQSWAGLRRYWAKRELSSQDG